ncbi:hypothetical protein UNPF46_30715 [Bradyrhizobium sp. UNPF46]|nr:hypothetical protein UNPF46_30715 [Bradyrhizobium sp. UNPF46]
MTRQEKRALIERLHDSWITADTRSIREVYAESFVAHMPKGWGPAPSRDGHDGIRRAILKSGVKPMFRRGKSGHDRHRARRVFNKIVPQGLHSDNVRERLRTLWVNSIS